MSKGSKPRPLSVSHDELSERWAMIDWTDGKQYRKRLAELVTFEDERDDAQRRDEVPRV